MRASKDEEQHPPIRDAKTMIANMPTNQQSKHADTNGSLQDDVSKKKMTSQCRHHPSGSPDLGFHPEDFPGIQEAIQQHLQQRNQHIENVDTVGTDRSLPGRAYARCLMKPNLSAPGGVALASSTAETTPMEHPKPNWDSRGNLCHLSTTRLPTHYHHN
jgi:hypothetical protein